VASISGYADIVQLLLEDGRSDLRNDIELMETLIQWESFRGHVEIVWLLMEDKRVDPSTDKNEAIRGACIYGHIEVVKLLLTDYRVTNDRKHLMMAADNATLWKYYDIKNLIMEAVKRDV
jgi:ankyrin repeat protein